MLQLYYYKYSEYLEFIVIHPFLFLYMWIIINLLLIFVYIFNIIETYLINYVIL